LPYLVLGVCEFILITLAVYLVSSIVAEADVFAATVGAVVLSACTLSMGVYPAIVKESFFSLTLRSVVSFFLLGSAAMMIVGWVSSAFYDNHLMLLAVIVVATAFVLPVRWLFRKVVDTQAMRRKVFIFGCGKKSAELLEDIKELANHRIEVVGCVPCSDAQPLVNASLVRKQPENWLQSAKSNGVTEIIIAPDERRKSDGAQLPLDQFLDCKLAGIAVSDGQEFCERELGRIDLTLLRPSWMLFSDGFDYSSRRYWAKRIFDISLSLLFLVLLWPFMLLTAIAVAVESGMPMLYSQERVGLNGKLFKIYKFRSMRQDAEKGGKAIWASKNDSRVTKVGAFIRNTRLDELPQIWNVIRGDMSFVGPRPERPQFVEELKVEVPFYDSRHKVVPGLMGWAQLNYPYGASVDDAKHKLEYDLYYAKNHSFMMDILIMIQTVEIVLLGKGVH
jgi:sugar transferase (PEP-CTERM system associated)